MRHLIKHDFRAAARDLVSLMAVVFPIATVLPSGFAVIVVPSVARGAPMRVHLNVDASATCVQLFGLSPDQSVTFHTANSSLPPVLHLIRKDTASAPWTHVVSGVSAVGAEVALSATHTSATLTREYAVIARTRTGQSGVGTTELFKNGVSLSVVPTDTLGTKILARTNCWRLTEPAIAGLRFMDRHCEDTDGGAFAVGALPR